MRIASKYLAVAVLAVVGCARFHAADEPALDGGVGGEDGGATVEAGRSCDPTAPFTALAPVPGVNTSGVENGSDVTDDELEMLLTVPGAPELAIARSVRASRDAAWSPPAKLGPTINAAGTSTVAASMSADRKTLYFTRKNNGESGNAYALYVATRPLLSAEFGAAAPLLATATVQTTWPRLRRDGKELCFGRGDGMTPTAGNNYDYDLFCARVENGVIGTPAPVTELNTDAAELAPVFGHDGLTLYFTSTRETHDLDAQTLWVATRPSLDTRWEAPRRVRDDGGDHAVTQPMWVSEDHCRMYLMTNRDATQSFDVWVATR